MSIYTEKFWVSLDPGLECCGWALWCGNVLFHAGVSRRKKNTEVPANTWRKHAWKIYADIMDRGPEWFGTTDFLVSECPQVYKFSKANPAGLIQVAAVMGAVSGVLEVENTYTYLPREWQGGKTKNKTETRPVIEGELSAQEKKIISKLKLKKGVAHNLWDAVGIGLWHCGRLQWNVSEPKKTEKVKNGTKQHQKPKTRGKPTSKPAKKTLLNASID